MFAFSSTSDKIRSAVLVVTVIFIIMFFVTWSKDEEWGVNYMGSFAVLSLFGAFVHNYIPEGIGGSYKVMPSQAW